MVCLGGGGALSMNVLEALMMCCGRTEVPELGDIERMSQQMLWERFSLAAREERENVMTDIGVKERCVTEDTVGKIVTLIKPKGCSEGREEGENIKGTIAKGLLNVGRGFGGTGRV